MLTAVLGETTSTKFRWCGGGGRDLGHYLQFSPVENWGFLFKVSVSAFKNGTSCLYHAFVQESEVTIQSHAFLGIWKPTLETSPFPLHSCIMASPSASARTHFKLWMGWLNGLKDASTPIQHLDGLECHDNAQLVHFLMGTAGIRFSCRISKPASLSCHQNH